MTIVPDDLKTRIDEAGKAANWSAIARQNGHGSCPQLSCQKGNSDMDDAVERLRASKRSSAETGRESGLEVGEWAMEAAKYGELLRIAKAVEEVRREIDVQTLQDLIDPERKMDAGDWVTFWEDRGFSGDCEPSDGWDRAFADRAAR